MLTIRDIMTTNVYTVDVDASAEEAAWGLTRRHIGGAPARDAAGTLVGVISKSDLFRRRDFSPRRKVQAPRNAEFAGQFASLGHLNTQLKIRRKAKP